MRRLSVLILAVALAACAGPESGPAEPVPGGAMGPGISVSEASRGDLEGPLLVTGYLFVEPGGRVVLSEAIAESFPPQPAGAVLEVVGLDPAGVEGLVTEGGMSWTERPVQVLGTVANGTITVATDASA